MIIFLHSFLFFLHSLGDFSCPIFKLAIPFFFLLKSSIELLWWFKIRLWKNFLYSILLFNYRSSNCFLFINSISYWYSLLFHTSFSRLPFISFFMVSFSSLSIFQVVNLKSSSNKSNVWASSEIPDIVFLPMNGIFFMFLLVFYNFLLRTGYF